MAVVSTLAVALRSFAYGETSRIIRFYTLELGILGVMARGVRKSGSKGRGGEPGTFARGTLTVHLKEGRGLQTFTDFSPDKPRRGLGADVIRFSAASVLGEILLRHAGEEENPSLFSTLDEALDALERTEGAAVVPELLARGWTLVDRLGYRPVLMYCVVCGDSLPDDELVRFDLSAGGCRCPRCAALPPDSDVAGRRSDRASGPRLGPEARRQLDTLLRGSTPADLRKPKAHLRLLEGFVTYHLSEGKPFRSFRVLQDLLIGEGV